MFSADIVAATQAHLEAAQRHLETARPAEAIVALRAALALMPMLPEPRHYLANTLRDQGHAEDAILEYRLAIHHAGAQKRRYPRAIPSPRPVAGAGRDRSQQRPSSMRSLHA